MVRNVYIYFYFWCVVDQWPPPKCIFVFTSSPTPFQKLLLCRNTVGLGLNRNAAISQRRGRKNSPHPPPPTNLNGISVKKSHSYSGQFPRSGPLSSVHILRHPLRHFKIITQNTHFLLIF